MITDAEFRRFEYCEEYLEWLEELAACGVLYTMLGMKHYNKHLFPDNYTVNFPKYISKFQPQGCSVHVELGKLTLSYNLVDGDDEIKCEHRWFGGAE